MEMTIDDKELATSLTALAIMCASEGTDGCDITISTSKGKFICHMEFSGVENGNVD